LFAQIRHALRHCRQASALATISIAFVACEQRSSSQSLSASAEADSPMVAVGPIPGSPIESTPRANPFTGDPAALQEGRRLFIAFNCSGCHGGRAGGGMGPSLRDHAWLYGNTDEQIFDSIARGRAHGMPAWGYTLQPQEIWKLVAYIQSLRTDREPQAPH
jgi:cytochrome c oxidase cbb3-type subunit 3